MICDGIKGEREKGRERDREGEEREGGREEERKKEERENEDTCMQCTYMYMINYLVHVHM